MKNTDIEYYESGETLKEICYDSNGFYHRTDYYKSGKIKHKRYSVNNERNDFVMFDYFESGQIKTEQYCVKGLLDRSDGPARIDFAESGEILREFYFINQVYLEGLMHYVPNGLFEYVRLHPSMIKPVKTLAKKCNWLNEDQLMLLRTINLFK